MMDTEKERYENLGYRFQINSRGYSVWFGTEYVDGAGTSNSHYSQKPRDAVGIRSNLRLNREAALRAAKRHYETSGRKVSINPFGSLPNRFNIKLEDLMPWLESVKDKKWQWFNNMNCKYVNIRIDTRHGGSCYITDDKGNQLSIDDLTYQGEDKNGPA